VPFFKTIFFFKKTTDNIINRTKIYLIISLQYQNLKKITFLKIEREFLFKFIVNIQNLYSIFLKIKNEKILYKSLSKCILIPKLKFLIKLVKIWGLI
jgi:hypothetical protein